MDLLTAVIITWKRQENIPKIVENLLSYPFIGEIMIKDNSKENDIIWSRYEEAYRAKNDIIYTQDDDCIVNNLQGIYSCFMENPNEISYSGIEGYEEKIREATFGDKQIAMMGWGSIFNRKWLKVFDEYIKIYGKDECFYREADRIFSLLQNKHHNFVRGGITHLKGKDDENAMCNQPDHIKFKNLAIERCLKIKSQ